VAISIDSTEVHLTGDNIYSCQDIYDYAINNSTGFVHNLGNTYIIDVDLRLSGGAKLKDTNISLTVHGLLWQIDSESSVEFGIKHNNDYVSDGCMVTMTNPKQGYGFGNVNKLDSGDCFFYGCIVNIPCFWGFFTGNNHIEVIGCSLDVYGRVSGPNSIVYNNKFKKAHGIYGGLTTKGEILLFDKNDVLYSELTTNPYYNNVETGAAIYHNPTYAGDLIYKNAILDGYHNIAYIENTTGATKLICLNCDIRGNYTLIREAPTPDGGGKVDFYQRFTFRPMFKNLDESSLVGAEVVIMDNDGVEIFRSNTDIYGKIEVELDYYFQNYIEEFKFLNPYTVTVTKDDLVMEFSLTITKPLLDLPIYITEGNGGGTGSCSYNQQELMDYIDNVVVSKLNTMSSTMSTAFATILTEVNENEMVILATEKDDVNYIG
jgi:hypothetical protein